MVPWCTRGQTEKQCRHLSTTFIPRMFFSLVAQSYPTLSDSMDCSTPGFPVHRQLPEFAQTHVHWISDAIQPSHSLSSPSPPALILSQCQGLFKWVSSSHQVAKVLELQLQHQSFQWGLISLLSKEHSRVFSSTSLKTSIMVMEYPVLTTCPLEKISVRKLLKDYSLAIKLKNK